MDPFTQRMLERARARREKIDQKLASNGQAVPKRQPLTENAFALIQSSTTSPVKSTELTGKLPLNSPQRTASINSPRRVALESSVSSRSPLKVVPASSPRKAAPENTVSPRSPQKTGPLSSPRRVAPECSVISRSPKKAGSTNSPRRAEAESSISTRSPLRGHDIIVTKKEYPNPTSRLNRSSDVSVEINIVHRDDVQIEVQVEERDAPMSVYMNDDEDKAARGAVVIKELEDGDGGDKENNEDAEHREGRSGLRQNVKSRLDRLGVLYSDTPELSSPIHRTEYEFTSATPPPRNEPPKPKVECKRKFGRLAALADQINNWEDDTGHHNYHPEQTTKAPSKAEGSRMDASTMDISVHSIQDINKALRSTGKPNKENLNVKSTINSRTFDKKPAPSTNECQRLDRKIVAALEPKGATATPRYASAPKMATMVVSSPPATTTVVKKPSLKKYRAPTPPRKIVTNNDNCESENEIAKDGENNVLQTEENDNDALVDDCIQTKTEPIKAEDSPTPNKGSPSVRRFAPKLNGNGDRSSVLSKAAMFEAGSPKAKDPAEMSLRERKALFEKNKGAAIIPKAPFGQAPSAKSLLGDSKAEAAKSAKPVLNTTSASNTSASTNTTKATNSVSANTSKSNSVSANTSKTNSREELPSDSTSQTSIGGGIKGKLAALFSKEQTISESTIAGKFQKEKQKDLKMLQNRFHYSKNKDQKQEDHDSEDDNSDHDPSEKAPLMGSSVSLAQTIRKPEIIANIPKVTFQDNHKSKSETALHDRDNLDKRDGLVIGSQPVKRRSSQDSPVVLSVLDDVKRIKVNNKKEPEMNGAVLNEPGLYPHLSDIETATSSAPDEESSDCGGSSVENLCNPKCAELNKSDNWADSSFGREVMNVVKKNNSYKSETVQRHHHPSSDSTNSSIASEMDDLLEEALEVDDLADDEGPTPPKLNKNSNSLTSKSFTYKNGSPVKQTAQKSEFKSPLKPGSTPARGPEKKEELVHSVSFYRRMQNASSQPTTPIRQVRHRGEDESPQTPAVEPTSNATTVRQRIKELHNEISKQQTVISQASQALNLCAATIEFSGSTEQAEGERLLLLATHRRQACLHEVQRLQVEGAGPAATAGMASLFVRSLSLPLRRDYIRQLNADGAVGHHAVCLLKCRDRVIATSMQLTKPASSVLHFPDEIRMEGLTSDFKITVEVYLLQASKELLPHDLKYHIYSSKKPSSKLTPKSKVSELKTPKIQSPAGPGAVRSPQFQPHGYCIFALQQASRNSFTLNKVPCGSPLEGSVNVKISAHIRVSPPELHAAFLTAFDDVSGLGAWHRRWCQLQAPRLSYWKYPDDVRKKMPIGDIDLATVISEKVTKAPRDLCARPNTLLLESSVPTGLIVPDTGSLVYVKRPDGTVVRRHLLAADTPEDRDVWLESLNRALEYVRCSSADDE